MNTTTRPFAHRQRTIAMPQLAARTNRKKNKALWESS